MKLRKFALLFASVLAATTSLSQASLAGFTDYDYTDGNTASWDIFYGPNYLQNFAFATETAGNPSDSTEAFYLQANVPGWQNGNFGTYATGPVGSNFVRPGNRELFYTFNAATVNFKIVAIVSGLELDTYTFQYLNGAGAAGISNVKLNGIGASDDGINENDVNFWTWNDLSLGTGEYLYLTFESTAQHSAFDAFQIQTDAQVIPEPSTYALMALGLGVVVCRFRKTVAR